MANYEKNSLSRQQSLKKQTTLGISSQGRGSTRKSGKKNEAKRLALKQPQTAQERSTDEKERNLQKLYIGDEVIELYISAFQYCRNKDEVI